MFASQASFTLHIVGVQNDFAVVAFEGRESISQPFRFDLTLVSRRPDIELDALLHESAFLRFSPDGAGVHGLIANATRGDDDRSLYSYKITLSPRLAYLAHRHNVRMFQQQNVEQIVAQILKDHGILADRFRFDLRIPSPIREYCVQYNESDLAFIQRLCAEEGIHYHFLHSEDSHLLVFGDDQTVFPKLAPLPFFPDTGMFADGPAVDSLLFSAAIRPSNRTTRDYDFKKPGVLLEASSDTPALPELEMYQYPGRFTDEANGRRQAKRALEQDRIHYQTARGSSDQPSLRSGHFLPLTHHPKSERNDLWLINDIIHQGRQSHILEEHSSDLLSALDHIAPEGYRNIFLVSPWDTAYRPPATDAKPSIVGTQSAMVTGPVGEDIHCDEYGRVKVQFHWDREGQRDEYSSCWLRVMSGWAGAHYGGVAIPRVGMEVLVSFLEGDPDQPIISDCLFNRESVTPYPLPMHKTRSVFRSQSSLGGGGANELRIEDLKGQEQIYLRAQHDWDQQIENDYRTYIGGQHHETIEGSSYNTFMVEEHHTVANDRKAETKASEHLSVGGRQHLQIGDGHYLDAGLEIHLDSGVSLVMQAGSELTFKAASHFLKIDNMGITTSVPITLGGIPGVGSAAMPLPPGGLQATDTDRSGEVMQKIGVGNRKVLMGEQQRATEQNKIFCQVCEKAKEAADVHP